MKTAINHRLLGKFCMTLAGLLALSAPHAVGGAGPLEQAQDAQPPPAKIVPRDWLVMAPIDRRGRRPFRPDAVFARHLLLEGAPAPEAGQKLKGETGRESAWEKRRADEQGKLEGERYGWAYSALESPLERVMLARLQGAMTLYVNGDAHVGDYYRYGFGGVPVHLRAGTNHIFVTGLRGSHQLWFEAPEQPLMVAGWDRTFPHLIAGENQPSQAGVLVLNASLEDVREIELSVAESDHFQAVAGTSVGSLPPLGLRKLAVPLLPKQGIELEKGVRASLTFTLRGHPELPELSQDMRFPQLAPDAAHRRSYRSKVDGAVLEYAVLPPSSPASPREPSDAPQVGLVLSLHGAGVHSMNQARSYSQRPDFWVVAPTNRRPFGFDWQDWGRFDAYEVLERALEQSGVSRERVYLTGHSMGGHGVWHLAANDPDGFAAVAPSAGWASFDSYGGGRPAGGLSELWHAADAASSTVDLLGNLAQLPTYILHGAEDDNVPMTEGRSMQTALEGVDGIVEAHYQEGAGHWWDGAEAAGADCVDWPPIFELFRAQRIASAPRELAFTSVDPGIDSEHYWASLWQPVVYGEPLALEGSWEETQRTLELKTHNVRSLSLRAPGAEPLAKLSIDAQELELEGGARSVWLHREPGAPWNRLSEPPSPQQKSPARSGPFKRVFDRNFLFVVGTRDKQIRSDLLARARYLSQEWWYRGNGDVQVMDDTDFVRLDKEAELGGRNVILFGNADSNLAWDAVFGEDCPIRAEAGAIQVGERRFEGDDLGCVFVFRRKWDSEALAGAFADSGRVGGRLTYTLAPFVSGVGYPDYTVFSSEILKAGDEGVLAAGWFDHAWRLVD